MGDKHYPNRAACVFADNSTAWNLIATDGVGYASYALLVAASKVPYPGPPSQFPTGIPRLRLTNDNGSGAVGAGFQIVTNTLNTPSAAEEYTGPNNQAFELEDEDVKSLWVKKTTGGDRVFINGQY